MKSSQSSVNALPVPWKPRLDCEPALPMNAKVRLRTLASPLTVMKTATEKL